MGIHGIKDTLRSSARGRSVSVSWNNGAESPSSMRERGSMRRRISNGLNGLGWGYDGSDSSGAGGSEDGNNGSSQQQLVSTSKRIGSMGSMATTNTTTTTTTTTAAAERSLAAGKEGGGLGTLPVCEVQPLLLGSLDLTLRNLGVGLGEGLGGVGLGGMASAAVGAGGGRSSRRVSMQYQSW